MEPSSKALRRVAPEIRSMIFKYAHLLPDPPVHQRPYPVPFLLPALRATPDLYNEALEVYYRINTFALNVETFRGFKNLKIETIKLIRNMYIIFTDFFLPIDGTSQETVQDLCRSFTYPQSSLALATGITNLFLVAPPGEHLIYPMIQNVLPTLKLRCFELLIERQNTVEGKELEAQVVAFVEGSSAEWEQTRGLAMRDEIECGYRYLQWGS